MVCGKLAASGLESEGGGALDMVSGNTHFARDPTLRAPSPHVVPKSVVVRQLAWAGSPSVELVGLGMLCRLKVARLKAGAELGARPVAEAQCELMMELVGALN